MTPDREKLRQLAESLSELEALVGRAEAITRVESHRLPTVLRDQVAIVLTCKAEPHVILDAVHIVEQSALEIERLRAENSRLTGRQCIPLVDQNGKEVGAEYLSFAELHRHEVHVDDKGTTWARPTAWAYMQACKALEASKATIRSQEAALVEAREALEDAAIWHEDHDKSLSKQPPHPSHVWQRAGHQEQSSNLRRAASALSKLEGGE